MSVLSQVTIVEYLSNNREHLMEKISGIKYMKESSLGTVSHVFHDDVMDQYRNAIRKIVVQEIAHNTNIDTETILVTLDDFDLKEFLDG